MPKSPTSMGMPKKSKAHLSAQCVAAPGPFALSVPSGRRRRRSADRAEAGRISMEKIGGVTCFKHGKLGFNQTSPRKTNKHEDLT